MAFPKRRGGALMALAASAGLWAWQNRDKISAWVSDQQRQMQQRQRPGSTSYPGPASGSYTGSTTRIGESSIPSGQSGTVLTDRPSDF